MTAENLKLLVDALFLELISILQTDKADEDLIGMVFAVKGDIIDIIDGRVLSGKRPFMERVQAVLFDDFPGTVTRWESAHFMLDLYPTNDVCVIQRKTGRHIVFGLGNAGELLRLLGIVTPESRAQENREFLGLLQDMTKQIRDAAGGL